MTAYKPQRIRDPVHNLIGFEANEFDDTLWRVVQTSQFQRLRRIRQLGFSELVFPGATHTRFAHSLGVLHTARLLMRVLQRELGTEFKPTHAQKALAAALVHDVGHNMFSHAFEAVARKLGLKHARHEAVSDALIRDSEITAAFNRLGSGFASDVADLIGREQPQDCYDAVVTSQFDADRLDYMQRDRMMTGITSGTVDVTWLLDNLTIRPVPTGSDLAGLGTIDTLVLGPKAFHVAESYVLALFHLYPNVYFHKATRGAEQVLSALLLRLYALVKDGQLRKTGLSSNHPLIRFCRAPEKLDRVVALDDSVLWGSLAMMEAASDTELARLASHLRGRDLLRCVDFWARAAERNPPPRHEARADRTARLARINLACDRIRDRAAVECPTVLIDDYTRDPYKHFQESRTPANQIHIMDAGKPRDMAELSSVVANAEPFRLCRGYIERGDTATESLLQNVMRTSIE